MSEYENMNREAIDAQQQYEAERQESSSSSGGGGGVQVNMQPPTNQQVQVEPEKPKVRPGWTTKDGNFWTFNNYDNLASEYKQFIPREATKSARNPNAKVEPVIHQDPFDGRTYKYGVTVFDNGGTSVWSRLHDPNRSSSSSYSGGKKAFYLDVGLKEMDAAEANALLAASEGDREYRYRLGSSFVMNHVAQAPDGNKLVTTKIVHVVLKQKRIEY